MTPADAKLILTYADSDMNAAAAGRRLYMSSGSVFNHLESIKTESGKDPRSFWGLVQLVEVAWLTLQLEQKKSALREK